MSEESASKSKDTAFVLEALPWKSRAAVPADQEALQHEVSEKPVTHIAGTPDGGFTAWLVIVALAQVITRFGIANTWGVFQAYYEENLLRQTSPSNIAWIGSAQYALIYFPALATGRMFDLGYFRIPFLAASCVIVASVFLTAECTQFWQFFLVQGCSLGVCCGIIVGPALVVISHWFDRKRGLAMSLAAIGASSGYMFPKLLKRRLPPVNVRGGLFNLKAFRNTAYTIYCISGILGFLGLYTELTYISVSAIAIGVSKNFAFYIIAIANGASTFGRLSSGLMADKIGVLNTMAVFTAMAGITTFAWPFATNESQVIAIATIYGFSSGGFLALFALAAVALGDIEDAGRRVGMFMSLAAFGAITGPPISGAISTASGGFIDAGFYAGGNIMCSAGLLLLARCLHLKRLWGKY
ncbi:MFS general substrate transporter [Suillus variegatus]|nr:MFS general substrate transporter [Suillus variegatus]